MAGDDNQNDSQENSTEGLASESSSSDFNPFPHAGDDVAPKKEKAIVGDDTDDPDSAEGAGDATDDEAVSEGGDDSSPDGSRPSDTPSGAEQATSGPEDAGEGPKADEETAESDSGERNRSKTKMGLGGVETGDSEDDDSQSDSLVPDPAVSGPASVDDSADSDTETTPSESNAVESSDESAASTGGEEADETGASTNGPAPSDGPQTSSSSESPSPQPTQPLESNTADDVTDSSSETSASPGDGSDAGADDSADVSETDDEDSADESEPVLTSDDDSYWGADESSQADEYHDEFFDPESGKTKQERDTTSDSGKTAGSPSTGSPAQQGPPDAASGPPGGATGGPPPGAGASPPGNGPGGSPGPAADDVGGGSPGHASHGGEPEFEEEELQLETDAQKAVTGVEGDGTESETGDAGWGAESDFDRVEPGQFGGSGFQKFANILFVALLVGNAFLAVVAFQNDGFIDFANFRHMLEVAFQGAEYEPRAEWTESDQPVRTVEPKDDVSFGNVFAHVASIGEDEDNRVLVMKGTAKNNTDEPLEDVEVRGLVYNREGKLADQAEAPLGADIPLPQLESLDSPDKVGNLQPRQAASLDPDEEKPFTIVFSTVPKIVESGEMVDYGVEIASPSSVAQ